MSSRTQRLPGAVRPFLVAAVAATLVLAASPPAQAINLPSGFSTVELPGPFAVPLLVRFSADGRWTFVVEKAGVVWTHDGVTKSAVPLVNLSDEVNNDGNRGLLGLAVPPDWTPDGGSRSWVYLLYTVTPVFGADYSYNQSNRFSFSRLKRCRTALNGGWPQALLDDEDGDGEPCQILLGHRDGDGRVDDGIASLHNSHATGDLHFARDGSLIVVNGDGAHYNFQDNGGSDAAGFQDFALDPPPGETAPWFGPMPLYEDCGSFRSQDLRSLAGKVLRLDPETGLGLPSNPYYTGNAMDHASKVWAGGLRNPYRSSIKPGTGSSNPDDGDPGVLYIGDVGWQRWEELNISRSGGENFGWPTYEGFGLHSGYASYRRDPNPLSQPDGAALGGKLDPAGFQLHAAPAIAWHHSNISLLAPSGLHGGFKGNTAVGGDFYTGSSYPPVYHGAYFLSDYGQSWIRVVQLDIDDNPLQILDFATDAGRPVDLERHPTVGDLYYISIGMQKVFRIRYGANTPPTAALAGAPLVGSAPLTVGFDASGSTDPEQSVETLLFDWDFDDGTVLLDGGPTVQHTFTAGGQYAVTVTVSDFDRDFDQETLFIDVDNGRPTALIVLPVDGSFYDDLGGGIPMQGAGADPEDPPVELTYDWHVHLHHDDPLEPSENHVHPDVFRSSSPNDLFPVESHGADDIISYELELTVTDTGGASDTARVLVIPTNIGIYPWLAVDLGPIAAGADTRVDLWGFDIGGAGAGAGGSTDQLRFVHRRVTGDFVLVGRVEGFRPPGGVSAAAGLLARASLAADATFVAALADGSAAVQGSTRAAPGAIATPGPAQPLAFPDVWLKIERAGDTFTTWFADGAGDWIPLDEVTLPLGPHVFVGMAVASGAPGALVAGELRDVLLDFTSACGDFIVDAGEQCDDGNLAPGDCCSSLCQFEASGLPCDAAGEDPSLTFTCSGTGICEASATVDPCEDGDACTQDDVCSGGICQPGAALDCDDGNSCTIDSCDSASGCVHSPDPGCSTGSWTPLDIGGALPPGSAIEAGSGFDITAGGEDVWGAADSFFYLYQPASGDFDLRARVDDLVEVETWTKAGLMVRTSLDPAARNLFALLTPSEGAWVQWRSSDGADYAEAFGGPLALPFAWLRLVREGGSLTASTSPDGASWTPVVTIDLGLADATFVGFAVTSHGQLRPTDARIRDISLSLATPPEDVCGDGLLGPTEECDDGGTAPGDCCSSTCVLEPVGAACDDDNACTNAGTCGLGDCSPGPPISCDDTDACTTDSCDPATGCANDAISCDDTDACTADSCDPATGCANDAISCDDTDACTADSCDPALGCVNEAIGCDDGDACTLDGCDSETGCTNEAISCDDTNACTADACDPATGCTNEAISCDDTDACTADSCDPATGCANEAISCDDTDACTADACDPATGCTNEAISCDDAIACTADSCDPALGCVNEAIGCDDGDACTLDGCDSETGCTNEAISCDDTDACTADSCDPASGCANDAISCDDTDACTADACDPATGCTNEAISCDDTNACTADSCDPATGCANEAISCDDTDACTADACDPATGCTNEAISCDDAIACTADSCDPALGCVNEAIGCDDGDACTLDGCDSETGCTNEAISCDDTDACTADSCDPASGCANHAISCDDTDACTADACDPATGCTNEAISCDDTNACTADSCDPATGCTNVSVSCDDTDACTADSCDPTTGCANDAISCDDGNACTADWCDAATGCANEAISCDDGDACTVDSCDPAAGCVNGQTDPGCGPVWIGVDIGGALPPGAHGAAGSGFDLTGGGADIWDRGDSFYFLYRPVSGDFDLSARVGSLSPTDDWAKVGLMVRASLAPPARNAMLAVNPSPHGSWLQWRETDGGGTAEEFAGAVSFPAGWVRLTRAGDTLRGYRSDDGTSWTLVRVVVIDLPAEAFVGLAITSHVDGTATAATIRDLTLVSFSPPSAAIP